MTRTIRPERIQPDADDGSWPTVNHLWWAFYLTSEGVPRDTPPTGPYLSKDDAEEAADAMRTGMPAYLVAVPVAVLAVRG
jgi:hypothetical protein